MGHDLPAARFGAVRERLRARAGELASAEPGRDVAESRNGTDPHAVAALPAMPVAAGAPVPLLRVVHGQFSDTRAWFLANKAAVDTPSGPVTLTLTVWTVTRSLEYLAVTPFHEDEGSTRSTPTTLTRPRRAARWVSINVPLFPDLLKTVTAAVHHDPDRARPHQPGYFEH